MAEINIINDNAYPTMGEELDRVELENEIINLILLRKIKKQSCEEISIMQKIEEITGKDSTLISKTLCDLVDKGKVSKNVHGKRFVYKIPNETTESSETQEPLDKDFMDDFVDFKKFITLSLASLNKKFEEVSPIVPTKISLDTNKQTSSSSDSEKIIEGKDAIIALLREEVKYLRKQNDNLLDIISYNGRNQSQNVSCSNLSCNEKKTSASENMILSGNIKDDDKNSTQHIKSNLHNQKEKSMSDNKSKSTVKKQAVIIGDSILNGVNERGIKSKNFSVSIQPYSGANSNDIVDYIKPIIRKSPDNIIIHMGTNDLKKNINTIENLEKICDYSKNNSKNTKIVISTLTIRADDKELGKKAKELNVSLEKFAEKSGFEIINNNNIDESCLSKKKLHLNQKGKSYLANNYMKFLNN